MRFAAASGKPSGMLKMKHLMVKHIVHNVVRNARLIQLAIDDDLTQRGIEATKLRGPISRAPAQPRFFQLIAKIASVELVKQPLKVVMRAGGAMFAAARPALAKQQ